MVASYNVTLENALLEYNGSVLEVTSGSLNIYYHPSENYYEYVFNIVVEVDGEEFNYSYSVLLHRGLVGFESPQAVYYYAGSGTVAGAPVYDVGPISGRGAFKTVFGFTPISAFSFCMLPFNVSSMIPDAGIRVRWVPPGGNISFNISNSKVNAMVTLKFSNEKGGFLVSSCSHLGCLPLYFSGSLKPDPIVPGDTMVLRGKGFSCVSSNGSGLVYVSNVSSKTIVGGNVVTLSVPGYGFACYASSVLANVSLAYDRSGFLKGGVISAPTSTTPMLVGLLFFPFIANKTMVVGDLVVDMSSAWAPMDSEGMVTASITGRVYLASRPLVTVVGDSRIAYLIILLLFAVLMFAGVGRR